MGTDNSSLTSKALSRLNEVLPVKNKADQLSAIGEEPQPLKVEIKPISKKEPASPRSPFSTKFDALNAREFYEYKGINPDDPEVLLPSDIFKERKAKVVKMMHENRPLFNKMEQLAQYLLSVHVDHIILENVKKALDEKESPEVSDLREIVKT